MVSNMFFLSKQRKKGFTLIELLVVIAIIGLLAAVVLAALESARAKARNAKKEETVRQYITALETYRGEPGVHSYPNVAEKDSTDWYCIGYDVADCFYGVGVFTDDDLNNIFDTYIPSEHKNTDPVPTGAFNLKGIGYRCVDKDEDNNCEGYQLRYYLEKTDSCKLQSGDTQAIITGENVRCTYIKFE